MKPTRRFHWLLGCSLVLGCSSGAAVVGSDLVDGGRADGQGSCGARLIVVGTDPINAVVADDTHAYVAVFSPTVPQGGQPAQGTAHVLRVALDGSGAPSQLWTEARVSGLAIDEANVYVARADDTHGAIVKLSKDGTASPVVLAAEQLYPTSVRVDATHVYWTNRGTLSTSGTEMPGGGVSRVAKSGGAVEQLAVESLEPMTLVVDDTSVYWTDGFYAQAGIVMAAPKDGSSAPRQLARGQFNLTGLAADAERIYWATGGGGQIVALPKTGGAPSSIVQASTTVSVVADGASIYFVSNGLLQRVASTGGRPESIGCRANIDPQSFAVTPTAVVVANGSNLNIVAKSDH
ncbi:hypothetical protein AKJ09_00758 [Labilithrix luteola]|uniref:Uncharacterized protein n=1 Tax=Labilithrix luteola TaxID=1391654 RepID=A0A0K1PLV6_9BACT|nr:hypothetical protein [Labilithrix luteola]AKU94094.1 hypothetical protein AKJ09_00758 [Labilithrix luteola]